MELALLQQEHRPLRVFYNLWLHRHDSLRRPAAVWAMLSWIFSPGVAAAAGVSLVGIIGVILADQANDIITTQTAIISDQSTLLRAQTDEMRQQNMLLVEQNVATLSEINSNLYFQQLSRRTHLLSVLYEATAVPRTRTEALKEYLRIDREIKLTEVRQSPERYRTPDHDPNVAIEWDRLVTLFPDLRTDLSDIKLQRLNLEWIDLSNVVLKRADFSCSNLNHANLRRADLTNAILVGCDLGGAHLDDATCDSTDFSETRLNGAYLIDTWLDNAVFDMAFLGKTNFGEYRNQRFPPKSATWALVLEPWDSNDSQGAEEFQTWALSHGAKSGMEYDEWQSMLDREVSEGRITRRCLRTASNADSED